MAVDPGGTTGVAWGRFPTGAALKPTVRASLARRAGYLGSLEIEGRYQAQAAEVVELWREFSANCERDGVRAALVIEDFVLRVKSASSDRAQLMPVRIAAAIEGILIEEHVGCAMPLGRPGWEFLAGTAMGCVVYQQPSAAKSYASDARLKRWGFWQVGSRHCRDSWRHALLYVAESTSKQQEYAIEQ